MGLTVALTSPKAPIMQIVVPLLFIFFALPGIVYGYMTKSLHQQKMLLKQWKILLNHLSHLLFLLFAAQFLYSFQHSNLGTLLALSGLNYYVHSICHLE